MNKKTITALAATIMMGMILPAFGGEGNVKGKSGKKYRIKGYGHSSQEAYHPKSVILTINRAIFTKKKEWKKKKITHREYHYLAKHLNYSTRLWENVPTSRIRFGMSYITPVMELNKAGLPKHWGSEVKRNMVTLNGALGGVSGHCQKITEPSMSDGSDGFEEYPHFGICIGRLYNDLKRMRKQYPVRSMLYPGFGKRVARRLVTHELGHGVGFSHSVLNNLALAGRTLRRCKQGVMSYSRDYINDLMDRSPGRLKKKNLSGVDRGVLNPEDVAIVSRLYPNFRNPLSRTTGTVRGIVLDSKGKKELYGANVFLVRRGVGMLSRISGYESSMPEAEIAVRNGDFVLNGVPPGTYDLLVASWDDKHVSKNGIGIYLSSEFDTGFKSAWVRGIRVRKGVDINVGYVQAGKNRPFKNPGLMDMAISFRASKAGDYRIRLERRSSYWAFLRWCTKKIKHRYHKVYESDSISFSKGTQAHTFRAKPGKYYASVFRVSGRNSKRVLFRKYVDLRASLVEANWNRKSRTVTTTRGGVTRKLPVEAWRYVITTTSRFQSHDQERTYALHGKRVLFFQAGSIRSPRVEADWGGDPVTIGLKKRCQTNTSGFAKIKVCLTYR